jgi:hypothetical protein
VSQVLDVHGRLLRNLRVSVTDRCNLRCGYCMPEEEYVWLPREEILHFGEIAALTDVFLTWAWTRCGSPAASRCSAGTCPDWSACWPRARASATWP